MHQNPCSAAASGVRARRWLMWALSSHLALSFLLPGGSPGFSALPLLQQAGGCPVIHPRLPAGNCLSVPAGLTCSHRVQPCEEEEARGEGFARLCGLAGSKGRTEKGFWIQSSQMTFGKPQVTAKLTGSKQQSPGGKMWRRQWQWWVFDGLVS